MFYFPKTQDRTWKTDGSKRGEMELARKIEAGFNLSKPIFWKLK